MRRLQIAPSLLAADFTRLGEQVAAIEAEVDLLHIDVMDGHFVPNLAIGIPVIASLRKVTRLTFDCHLMTTNPDAHLETFSDAGADLITMHIEAVSDPTRPAGRVRALGMSFGLVISPHTPFEAVAPFMDLADLLLIMSVEPGFGGQEFMEEVLPKVAAARDWVESRGLAADIEIDGGITPVTARRARDAGANVFVAGTAIFGAADPAAAVAELRRSVQQP